MFVDMLLDILRVIQIQVVNQYMKNKPMFCIGRKYGSVRGGCH